MQLSRKKRDTSRQLFWTNYQSLEDITAWFEYLAVFHSDVVTLINGGTSHEGILLLFTISFFFFWFHSYWRLYNIRAILILEAATLTSEVVPQPNHFHRFLNQECHLLPVILYTLLFSFIFLSVSLPVRSCKL